MTVLCGHLFCIPFVQGWVGVGVGGVCVVMLGICVMVTAAFPVSNSTAVVQQKELEAEEEHAIISLFNHEVICWIKSMPSICFTLHQRAFYSCFPVCC